MEYEQLRFQRTRVTMYSPEDSTEFITASGNKDIFPDSITFVYRPDEQSKPWFTSVRSGTDPEVHHIRDVDLHCGHLSLHEGYVLVSTETGSVFQVLGRNGGGHPSKKLADFSSATLFSAREPEIYKDESERVSRKFIFYGIDSRFLVGDIDGEPLDTSLRVTLADLHGALDLADVMLGGFANHGMPSLEQALQGGSTSVIKYLLDLEALDICNLQPRDVHARFAKYRGLLFEPKPLEDVLLNTISLSLKE